MRSREDQNIEWKSKWRDEHLEWICAFANTDGGQLIIGKTDKGEPLGDIDIKKLLEDIPSKIKNHLGLIASVMTIQESGEELIEIIVQQSSVPVSYKGRYFVRSGSTKHMLEGSDLMDFLLKKSHKSWDAIEVEGLVIDDMDTKAISQYIEDGQKTGRVPDLSEIDTQTLLQKLRLTDGPTLRRGALVLFGRDPSIHIPASKVKIGRFREDAADLAHQDIIEGNLIHLLYESLTRLSLKYLEKPLDFSQMVRQEKNIYPPVALREMLLNALVHRDLSSTAPIQIRVYDDKISIWNPGTLPPGLNADDLLQEHNSIPRNPLIAEACFKAGYIEAWGRGTLMIAKACKEAELPQPSITEKNGGMEVMIYKYDLAEILRTNFGEASEKLKTNNESKTQVIVSNYATFRQVLRVSYGLTSEYVAASFGDTSEKLISLYGTNKALLLMILAANPQVSAAVAANRLGVSSRTVETYIADLKTKKIIHRKGHDKGGHWTFSQSTQ